MNSFAKIVFFGSLWGLTESSLGFLLHMLSRFLPIPGIAGFIMFPIASVFMLAAYGSTGRLSAIPSAALVAAGTKLLSLLHPAVTPLFVVNPVLAILAEGAVLWFAAAAFGTGFVQSGKMSDALSGGLIAAVGWRLLFLLTIFLLPVQKGILNKGLDALLIFILLEGAVSGLFLGTGLWLRSRIQQFSVFSRFELKVHPGLSLLLFVGTGMLQAVLGA